MADSNWIQFEVTEDGSLELVIAAELWEVLKAAASAPPPAPDPAAPAAAAANQPPAGDSVRIPLAGFSGALNVTRFQAIPSGLQPGCQLRIGLPLP